MPNHFYAIMEIVGAPVVVAQNTVDSTDIKPINKEKWQPHGIAPTGRNTPTSAKKNKTVGDIIGALESITTIEYIRGVKNKNLERFNGKLWQRNYWEHIIRNEQSYNRISQYIYNNSANWFGDKLFNK